MIKPLTSSHVEAGPECSSIPTISANTVERQKEVQAVNLGDLLLGIHCSLCGLERINTRESLFQFVHKFANLLTL